ncbi:mediator of RNA polymerase ii transcription subunit 21, partial [Phtheirospermum japonicum]
STIAVVAFNTFGTLQRDAPPIQLSPNYPDPPPANNNSVEDATNAAELPNLLSAELVKAAKQVYFFFLIFFLLLFYGFIYLLCYKENSNV